MITSLSGHDAAVGGGMQLSPVQPGDPDLPEQTERKKVLFNARQKRKLPVHNCCSICIVCFRHLKLVKLPGEECDQ